MPDKTHNNQLTIPIDALVVLVGPAASGKSRFASRCFSASRIISSDRCREMVSDDPANQQVSREAFHVMMTVINHRLRLGRATVADSTALNPGVREQFRATAEKHDRPAIAILFDVSAETCKKRNEKRDRSVPEDVIEQHVHSFQTQKERIRDEPFDRIYTLTEENASRATVRYQNTSVRIDDSGPFDVIGDVHGCLDELKRLLERLGYERDQTGYYHPDDRKAVFIGDLTDRGPNSVGSLVLAMDMVQNDRAYYIPGNHCQKLYRYLTGDDDSIKHGLETTVEELRQLKDRQRERIRERFLQLYDTAPPYLILDGGDLIVSHAGIREEDIGEVNERIVDFCLYGDTTGETLHDGFPVRRNWPLTYRGDALVVYGHTPSAKATKVNHTINIDQGAVYGGYLTALRYPEDECVNVKSDRAYHPEEPVDVQALQYRHAEKVFRKELMTTTLELDTEPDLSIEVPENVLERGLDRIARSDFALNQLLYLPSEPARAMPSSQHGSSFQSCCQEMVDHFRENDLDQVRVVREDPEMRSAVLTCFRHEDAAERFFGCPETVHLWDRQGQRITLSPHQKARLNEQVFKQPWLIDRDTCVITEGLWRDPERNSKDNLRNWIHRDRFELQEVVNRLRDAESRVGAVNTVLEDLEDIHSNIGRLAEKAFGSEDAFSPIDEQETNTGDNPSSASLPDAPFFLPVRLVASNQRILLGTAEERPAGRPVWGLDPSIQLKVKLARTISIDEIDRHLNQLWTDRPSVSAWWVLPAFNEDERWTGNLVPAFHLAGQEVWNLSELISPRRWWGQDVKAHWAGWNSARKIFAVGRESIRRFVGSLDHGFVVQTVAAQAGLSHW